jgi:hypothetical protein
MDQWIDAITDIAIWAVALLAIFEGVRRIASRRRTRTAIVMATVGLLWLGLKAGIAFFVGQSLNELRRPVDTSAAVAPLREDWGANMPGPERERAGTARAAAVFLTSGHLVDYFDQTGQRRQFSPNQEQIRKREETVRLAERLRGTSEYSLAQGVMSIVSAVVAVVLGAAVGAKYDPDAG